MTEKTWFDETFDDHLLVRDLVLVSFLVFAYGVPMGAFFGGFVRMEWALGIGSGVVFAALFLSVMEVASRRKGESMFRYFLDGDPLTRE